MNRKQRRSIKSIEKNATRKILSMDVGPWITGSTDLVNNALAIQSATRNQVCLPGRSLSGNTMVYYNNRYEVLITDHESYTHMRMARIDRAPIDKHWSTMNKVKSQLVEDGNKRWGMEFYPPDHEILDQSNWYHMWILKLGETPELEMHCGPLLDNHEEKGIRNAG